MEFKYSRFNADKLHEKSLADLLVNIEADFEIVNYGSIVYSESAFPVAELARALSCWVKTIEEQPVDFAFDSLSFDEIGAVTITKTSSGWSVGSIFTSCNQENSVSWEELLKVIREFVIRVRQDCESLDLDATIVPLI